MVPGWPRQPITRTRAPERFQSLASARHKLGRVFLATMVAISSWAVIQAPQAAYAVAPTALINGDTVTGGSASVEATLATADGFVVTVVGGAAWDAMTPAQFATYQVLIAGDPTCGILAPSFTSNSGTWAPVVMGTSINTHPGNRILIGTDPVFHRPAHPGADHLIKDGIAFAGALSGRTGLYFDASCFDETGGGTTIATLAKLSTGAGTWTENPLPPCGGSVSLIAANPAFSDLTSSDLQGWGCSDHETWPTFQNDWSPLAVATDTPTKPTCGTDPNTGTTACGEAYILIAGAGTVVTAPNIAVTPALATDPVGGSHTVTATVTTNAGAPVVGQKVDFTITGQNAGVSGTCSPATCMTNTSGQVTFTYPDTNGAGDDTIIASFTDAATGTKQSASALKHWVSTATDPAISASEKTLSATEGATFSGVVATFTDPDAGATAIEYSATIDWGDGTSSAGAVSGPTSGPFTVSGSHTYADEQTDAITVTITDVDTSGNTATAHSTANVADAPLTAGTLTLAGGTESSSATTASFTFSDANPGSTVADFTTTISWGDGFSSAGTVSGPSGGPYTVTGSHTYVEEGSYAVTVTVTDDGGSTTSSTGLATVADAALSAVCAAPANFTQSFNGPTATFTDAASPGGTRTDFTATIDWGDGSSSAGAVGGADGGPYTVSGSHKYANTGNFTITTSINDVGGAHATASCKLLTFAFAPGGGAFAIGDGNSAIGTSVTFWGAQWGKLNSVSGGAAPAGFKGFAENPTTPSCLISWTADPGSSTPPPAGPLPAYMAVIVTSSVSQSDSAIFGKTVHIVVVKTDPGYAPDTGHPGTGTVVAQIC
jgi:hypothetical protein